MLKLAVGPSVGNNDSKDNFGIVQKLICRMQNVQVEH